MLEGRKEQTTYFIIYDDVVPVDPRLNPNLLAAGTEYRSINKIIYMYT